MIFDTLGDRKNPVILMMNGSFTTGKGLVPIAEKLRDEFYVILPTYDGHHENGGEFSTRIGQAEKIYRYLLREGIEEIAVVQGASMGAEIAVEVIRLIYDEKRIRLNRAFLDGGPFFHFPAPFRKLMQLKFTGFVMPGKHKSKDDIGRLLNNRMVKWMCGGNTEAYRQLMTDMMECSEYMTKRSVRNESDACYTFDMYEFSEEFQKKLVFSWSSDEPAFQSKKNIVRKAPHAVYKTSGRLGHCGLLVKKPDKYAGILRKLAGA